MATSGIEGGNNLNFIALYNKKEEGYNFKLDRNDVKNPYRK